MALEDNNMVMPVTPAYGGNGFGGFGGDGSWLILFLLIAMMGWGNGFGGVGGNALGYDFPWLLNGQAGINANTNAAFDNAAVLSQLSGIQSAVNSGFAGAEVAACGRATDALQTAYNNEIASLERSFASQTANAQGFNNLQAQLAQCCCDNRLATAQTQALVQSENCADRAALSDGIRDIITNQTMNTQKILDTLCQDKIDSKNEKIVELQNQINMATLRESQTAQNAYIAQGFANEVDQLYNRLSNCPVPTTPVYGRTPIFTCGNNGCGCGCNM